MATVEETTGLNDTATQRPPAWRASCVPLWQNREELANTITHAVGLALCLVAGAALIAAGFRSPQLALGAAVYVATMIAVYTASTLSHAIQRPRARQWLRRFDQAVIYLFIVGTYTPFALAYLNHGWTQALTIAMWLLAGVGFASKMILAHRVECVSVVFYLVLGWMPMMAMGPILANVPMEVGVWVLAGGMFYSVGAIVLMFDERAPYLHALWHVFVIAGSACHYYTLSTHVLAAA